MRTTRDAYVGLENPAEGEWHEWHRAMLDERARVLAESGFDPAVYDDPSTAWSDRAFRQYFLFMYDTSFFDREARTYRTSALVDRWQQAFGRIDEVLLWHAYPRLGFDRRTQFDFYREMPGGLAQLRAEVSDVLHARGIRVLVDYNPWDRGTYDELAEIVQALDADGVMLDTMTDLPNDLAAAVRKRKSGVVFAPELRAKDEDLRFVRQSWAQWLEVGDASTPSIYRQRWLVPRHRQHAIARWDTSRRRDIVYSFFNGSGLILWENVFGSWNPYSQEDRRLVAETAAVLDRYEALFVEGDWLPLVPTGIAGLDANRWTLDGKTMLTLRNRTDAAIRYRVPAEGAPGLAWFAFWNGPHEVAPGSEIVIGPEGAQALVLDEPAHAREAIAHFEALSRRADVAMPEDDTRCPHPRSIAPARSVAAREATGVGPRRIAIPGGRFAMKIRHDRRESGCYPLGATDDALWGWFYKDIIEHTIDVEVAPFAIDETSVTNDDYLAFVHATGYVPADPTRFLAHLPRAADGSLPRTLDAAIGELPVTYVSLADARAYAAARGARLPTEAEWQWAAEGAGASNTFPWGEGEKTFADRLRRARDPETATPQGVLGLSGNAWELTESEHTDGHTRFVMLRGGVFLPPGESEWLVARGPRPANSHVKYILFADALDRCESISFRTVCDVAVAASR